MVAFLSIDPGAQTGWCYYEPPTWRAGVVTWDAWAQWRETLLGLRPDRFVVEQPQVYRVSRSKVDPNDMVTLALRAGMLAMFVGYTLGVMPTFVTPHTWKGSLPKDVGVNRIRLATGLARQAIEYQIRHVPKSYQHNAWDAVGINLYMQGIRI